MIFLFGMHVLWIILYIIWYSLIHVKVVSIKIYCCNICRHFQKWLNFCLNSCNFNFCYLSYAYAFASPIDKLRCKKAYVLYLLYARIKGKYQEKIAEFNDALIQTSDSFSYLYDIFLKVTFKFLSVAEIVTGKCSYLIEEHVIDQLPHNTSVSVSCIHYNSYLLSHRLIPCRLKQN